MMPKVAASKSVSGMKRSLRKILLWERKSRTKTARPVRWIKTIRTTIVVARVSCISIANCCIRI